MIRFACPNCQNVFQAPSGSAGKKTTCPNCSQRIQVPAPVNKTVLGVVTAPVNQPSTSGASLQVQCPGCSRSIPVGLHELPLTIECAVCKTAFEVAVPGTPVNQPSVSGRACPFCAEKIGADAIKCKHCGELLDASLREAREMSQGHADGVGLISITLAALALIGSITGVFCFGYGTLIGIPIALAGMVVAIFAGKNRKAAFILNAAALVPPIVLGIVVVLLGATILACLGLGSQSLDRSPTTVPVKQLRPSR